MVAESVPNKGDNLNNVRREIGRNFWKKKGEYPKEKIISLK
jgi:hypothetical protein